MPRPSAQPTYMSASSCTNRRQASVSSAWPAWIVTVASLASRASRPASAAESTWRRRASSCTSSRECASRRRRVARRDARRRRRRAEAVEVLDEAEHCVPVVRLPERGVARFLPARPASPRPTSGRAPRATRARRAGRRPRLPIPPVRARRPPGSIRGRGRLPAARARLVARPDRRTRRRGRSPSRAVMKRNWSPSGNWRSTIAVAILVSRCRSTARLSGRAPSSALKPFSIRKSTAASSHSTAHGCIRKPRRVEHVGELLLEQAAHDVAAERPEDDDTVEAVQELGPERPLDGLEHVGGVELAGPADEARRPARVGIAEPRFEVRMITQWRRSTVRPLRSVSRPSSKTCRKTSQICGCAFSNSSSRSTENGCLRTWAISGAACCSGRRRRRGAGRGSRASGTRSCRAGRAGPRSRRRRR